MSIIKGWRPLLDYPYPLSIAKVWTPSFPMAEPSIVLLKTIPLCALVVGAESIT